MCPNIYEAAYRNEPPMVAEDPVAWQQLAARVPLRITRAGCRGQTPVRSGSLPAANKDLGALVGNMLLQQLQQQQQKQHSRDDLNLQIFSMPMAQESPFAPAPLLAVAPADAPPPAAADMTPQAGLLALPAAPDCAQQKAMEEAPRLVDEMVLSLQQQLRSKAEGASVLKRPAAGPTAQGGDNRPAKVLKRPAAADGSLILGCSKCRRSTSGCAQCKDPNYAGRRGHW